LRQHYPDLDARPVHNLAGPQCQYLKLDASRMAPLSRGLPIAALVFPCYESGAVLEPRRMTATEALAALCHARSMPDRRPELLAETLRWVQSVPAYRLIYGELDAAVDRVLSLRCTGWRPNIGIPLDQELGTFLEAIHTANTERNSELGDELAAAVGILNRAGIEPVLLKGAIRLIDGLHPNHGWRMLRDLDLLVPEAGFATVLRRCWRLATFPLAESARACRSDGEGHWSR
jgi:hypothetical protein